MAGKKIRKVERAQLFLCQCVEFRFSSKK